VLSSNQIFALMLVSFAYFVAYL